ncbi:MAG: hypothetical protein ABUS56_00865 [Acidobacteriota bacterium]
MPPVDGQMDLYPPIEPHDHGMLSVGDGNFIAWEVSGAPAGKPAVLLHGGPGQGCAPNMRRGFDDDILAFVRICTHYLHHAAWLEEGALIRDAGRLAGVPGVLIHGRRDMSCPIDTAWALSHSWPGAELIVVEDAGHLRSDTKRRALVGALDRFALAKDLASCPLVDRS